MITGNVFNIEHFAIHDGPGIRTTVFLKGCPMACIWCHNPEGLSTGRHIVRYDEKCIGCGNCVNTCPQKSLGMTPDGILRDTQKCLCCGKCVEICCANAVEMVGGPMTSKEVADIALKDVAFYDESGGGVTFSGGEPLLQWEFVSECSRLLKEKGIHIAVETSGCVGKKVIKEVAADIDLFLYDLKHIDTDAHKEYCGTGNEQILENLQTLSETGKEIIIRMVVVPGVNDDPGTIERLCDFLERIDGVGFISLLPLHKSAAQKYRRLDKSFPIAGFEVPDGDRMALVAGMFKARGFSVQTDG